MLAAALLLAAQTASPVADPFATWNGITLGAPASTLRTQFGDPLSVTVFENGTRRIARYWLPGSNTTYVLVIETSGYIVATHIYSDPAPTATVESVPPDPFGIRLGDTREAVAKHVQLKAAVDQEGAAIMMARPSPTIAVIYTFQNDRVQSEHWGTLLPAGKPELAPLIEASGDATASAVLDVQRNESDGVGWEYRYLAFHPCSDTVRWQLKTQSLLQQGGRAYDRLHVVCPATKAERDFYFDITSYFGKL